MACNFKTEDHQQIYDMIRALVEENPDITLKGVIDTFEKEMPGMVPENMVIESLVLPEEKNVDATKKKINKKLNQMRKEARLADKLDRLLQHQLERKTREKVPPTEEVEEINAILNQLQALASLNEDLTDEQFAQVIGDIENIRIRYNQAFDTDAPVSKAAIKNALDNLKSLREQTQMKRYNRRMEELKEQLARLEDPEADITDLLTDNTSVAWKPLDEAILRKKIEIEDLKQKVQEDIARIRRKKLSEKGINLFGFPIKGKVPSKMVELGLIARELGWELPRTMAFMFDASAFMVQLAPVVVQEFASPISNAYRRAVMNEPIQVFAGWNRLGMVFNQGFWQVVKSDLRAINRKQPGSLKSTKGLHTRKMFDQIVNDEHYQLMEKAGLKISQAKSLTDSEEFYRTSLVNRIPLAGWIKDASEDTMVTTLNLYRVSLFKQFYEANPGLGLDEYKKIAEHINNLTGTTNFKPEITGSLSYVMSAPRLLISRAKLAFQFITGANLKNIDIPKTVNEGGLTKGVRFKTPADAFMFNHLAGMGASYAALFAATAALATQWDFIDFEEDWEEADFLRIRVGNTAFDITGGVGILYRTMAQAIYLTFGPSEGASESARKRINYLRNVKNQDALGVIMRNLVRYKLHPTITSGWGMYTGENFFGEPYDFFQAERSTLIPGEAKPYLGPIPARTEALLRAMMPIFMSTMMEQYSDATPNTGFFADSAVNLAQFFGMNTFEYSDLSQDVRVREYFNELRYKPARDYPDPLSKKLDNPYKEYLKIKYKELEGNALGQLVLDNGADASTLSEKELKLKWKTIKRNLHRDFVDKYQTEINNLQDKPEKKKEATGGGGRPKRPARPSRPSRG